MPAAPEELADHVRFLGILTVVIGVIAALGCIMLLVIAGFVWFPREDPQAAVRPAAMAGLGVLGLFLLATWGIAAGAGLLSRQAWARTLGLPLSVILLPAVPFGTMYGVYGLWVLTRDGVVGVLDAPLPWAG